MKNLQNLVFGLLTAIVSSFIVIGGVSLALAEGIIPTLIPTQVEPTLIEQAFPSLVAPSNNQIFPIFTSAPTATITATLPAPTACPPPKGWQPYTIQIGDTLGALANHVGISPNQLSQANCLLIDTLLPDTILYVPPPKPTATLTRVPLPSFTSIPCGPPVGWVRYIVKPADTLFKLSSSLGVTIFQLQNANCLGNSQFIMAGETLFVPYVPNITAASPTFTPQPTVIKNTKIPTKLPTQTPLKTNTPVNTAIPTATILPSLVPTEITPSAPLPTADTPSTAEPTAA